MDANPALTLMVALAATVLALRSMWGPSRSPGWAVVASVLFVTLGSGWFFWRALAGYVGIVVWLLLVVAPSSLEAHAAKLVRRNEFIWAAFYARLGAWLHPADRWPAQSAFLSAMARAQVGDLNGAERLLAELERRPAFALFAAVERLRIRGDWAGVATLVGSLSPSQLARDPSSFLVYLRALAEIGDRDAFAQAVIAHQRLWRQPGLRAMTRLFLFAFGGKLEALDQLLESKVAVESVETAQGWWATGLAHAGRFEEAQALLEPLTQSPDKLVAASAKARLAALPSVSGATWPAELLDKIDGEALELAQEQRYSASGEVARPRNVVVPALAVLISAGFAVELFYGVSTDAEGLLRLGALWPAAVLRGEWWRALAFLFLHYGVVHLLFNLVGLLAFGRYVEPRLGRIGTAAIYLVSGLAGAGLYVVSFLWFASGEGVVVGASGSVMGLVGATAAVLLRGWRREGARIARRGFLLVVASVALQCAFDVLTPNIGILAHVTGLIAGFLIGLVLSRH